MTSRPERRDTVMIIAEAGVNHNGSVDRALELIDAAARAGANAIKFQSFKADALASAQAEKAAYQKRVTTGDTQRDMLRALELDAASHRKLAAHANQRGLIFLSTPFDPDSADFLALTLNVPAIKISSGDATNAPLLLHIARLNKPVILSTGMCTIEDVGTALGVLAFGFSASGTAPSLANFQRARESAAGQQALLRQVTLLHCTTEYPAPLAEVNLRAMTTLCSTFGLPVGYSDHTAGINVALAAVALGASTIEKHLTLDRNSPGPDHAASLEPTEFAKMVADIREVELALGSPEKQPAPSELNNLAAARRSLVTARPVRRGEVFTLENLTVKRPGVGIAPIHYWDWLGRRAARDYGADELVE